MKYKLQPKDRFTSGDIHQKLKQAIARSKTDPSYQIEVEALSEALPTPVPFERLIIKLGATWIPITYYEKFCREVLNLEVKIFYSALVHEWDVRLRTGADSGSARSSDPFKKQRVGFADTYSDSGENYDWGWLCDRKDDFYRVSEFPAIAKLMSGGLFTLALNQQLPEVKTQAYQRGPKEVDLRYTRQAIAKQNQLKRRFEAWCREDPDRADDLSRIYNAKINCTALTDWTNSGLHLKETLKVTGINPGWLKKLRNYQLDAIWRFSLEGGVVALEVGLGKTAIAIAVIMLRRHYRRHKGLSAKALIVVQRSTLNQFYDTFLEMFPDARILRVEPQELNGDLRQNTLAKIAYLNFDAVIMTHDSFETIPVHYKTELMELRSKLREVEAEMVNLYVEGQTEVAVGRTRGNAVLKRLDRERTRIRDRVKVLEARKSEAAQFEGSPRYATASRSGGGVPKAETVGSPDHVPRRPLKLIEQEAKPEQELLTWEYLEFNFLLVDEIQKYKNNAVDSNLAKRVSGLSVKASSRAQDFDLKIAILRRMHGDNALVGMSGTPEPTNSLLGVYVFQKYFQPEELTKRGIAHFDAWVANFGEIKSTLEPKIDGKWRLTERLTDFINVAELACIWFNVVHYRRYDKVVGDFGQQDQRPEPKYITVNNQMSSFQTEKMAEISDRYSRLKASNPCIIPTRDDRGYLLDPQGRLLVHPKTKALIKDLDEAIELQLTVDCRADNFLLLTGDSRKLMIAPQLIKDLPVEPESKLAKLADKVLEIYRNTKSDRLTQVVFFDIGTPSGSAKFNIYQWLKDYWVENQVPADEIAFIQNYRTPEDKDLLFARLNQGEVRILIASSEAGGIGVNIQERLVAIHHGDLCYRPDQLEQREGRGIRQGNINSEIEIYRYITQGSKGIHGADTVMLQFLQNKQITRDRFFNGDPTLRRLSDGDTGAELYMMLKAESTGDERIIRYTELEVELEEKTAELSLARSELTRIESTKVGSIKQVETAIALLKEDRHKFARENETIETANQLPAPKTDEEICGYIVKEVLSLDFQVEGRSGFPTMPNRLAQVSQAEELEELKLTAHEICSYKGLVLFASPYGNGSFALWLEGCDRYPVSFRKTPERLLKQLNSTIEQITSKSDRYWQEKIDEQQVRLGKLKQRKQEIVESIQQLEVTVNDLDSQRLELQQLLEIEN